MHFRPMLVEASIYKGFPQFRTLFLAPIFRVNFASFLRFLKLHLLDF
jgi:hypothetical protein